MKFIDTHCHLYDEAYGGIEGQDEAIKKAIGAGVTMMIIPDTCSNERTPLLDLCSRWPEHTRACLGLHPTELGDDWHKELDLLDEAVRKHPEIVAIGETGLDLHFGKESLPAQLEAFRRQLDIALEKKLPVIVHCRDASEQCFSVLESYRGRGLKGVFHAFSGSIETFRRLEKYGDWYVGIGGVLTFKKASIADTVVDIPLDRIVLETDSPYLTPTPYRGTRNDSSYIPLIAEFLASRKGVGIDTVADITTRNASKLFSL